MVEIKNIVVPFDFSNRCRSAAGHAVVLARRFQAPITLLHVIPYSSFEYSSFEAGVYVGSAWPSQEEVEQRLRAEMKAMPGTESEKQDWRVEAMQGEPPLRIAEFVSQLEAPLVVMPTHGHGAFRRFILGSVTAKALHDLTCPVLTGAHIEDQPAFAADSYAHVACAVDLSEHSLETLRYAADFAAAWEAPLTVMHASNWLAGVEADESLLPPEMRERLLDVSRGQVAALLHDIERSAEIRVGFGRAADYVPQAIRETGADLLVVGRRTESGGGGLGSHGYQLIRSAPCPVLSV